MGDWGNEAEKEGVRERKSQRRTCGEKQVIPNWIEMYRPQLPPLFGEARERVGIYIYIYIERERERER